MVRHETSHEPSIKKALASICEAYTQMLTLPSFLLSLWLLATSNSNGSGRKVRKPDSRRTDGPVVDSSSPDSKLGRRRYNRSGTKRSPTSNSNNQRHHSKQRSKPDVDPIRLPDITGSDGIRPTYFTCRHTYEEILMKEIQETFGQIPISSPAPGLVECLQSDIPPLFDPVYALQSLPECVVVSADSIKGISDAIQENLFRDSLILQTQLRDAPRASLAIHGLVPGMFKGQPNPVMLNRAEKVVENLSKSLKQSYAAARNQRSSDDSEVSDTGERWLLQVLLFAPNLAAASLVKCQALTNQHYWPNWHLPAGMAKVDITDRTMPSSAYRKLMEALECMRIRPYPSTTAFVVDLGACPGGWTSVLRCNLDCKVLAIDRSPLDPALMKDPQVEFIKGDAFTFEPPKVSENQPKQEVWMVSDVIAYPDRILELIRRWCGGKWATHLVITMKFQGSEPSFTDLQTSIDLAKSLGYDCRAKHFFNNKNEVTLMLIQDKEDGWASKALEPGVLGTPMYKALLPNR